MVRILSGILRGGATANTTSSDIPLPALHFGETSESDLPSLTTENALLREALIQNNSALRANVRIITQLKKDVEWIADTSECKLKLYEEELKELKKENQDLKKSKKKGEEDTSKGKSKKTTPIKEQSVDERDLQIKDLTQQLEDAQSRSKSEIAQLTAFKVGLERDLSKIRTEVETLTSEKWKLAATNADLQTRLQSMTMVSSNLGPDPTLLLQDEIRKMQMALTEERKVTEKLSHSLELEKRKVESLEQKAKAQNQRRTHSQFEELKLRDERLINSMEKYRLQCENLGSSLEECEGKLKKVEGNEDETQLKLELGILKKLLIEEKKRSTSEQQKLEEMSSIFETMLKDYQSALESLNEVQNEKKMKNQQHSVYDEIRESNYTSQLDTLTAKLFQSEELVKEEKNKVQILQEKLSQLELDAEAIPILKAQVEVYQSDFNAERRAREKIAGEKADLEEELRKMKASSSGPRKFPSSINSEYILATETRPGTSAALRNTINHLADQSFNSSSSSSSFRPSPNDSFTCPKCLAPFSKIQEVETHVNNCLDQE